MNNPNSVGMLIPPPNVTLETELIYFKPAEINIHWNRVPRSTLDVTEKSLLEMTDNAVSAAKTLAMSGVSIIVFACTSGSFILGKGWDEKLSSKIFAATKLPSITTSTAMLNALKTIHTSRICLATPYISSVTKREVEFLERNGLDVVSSKCLGITNSQEIAKISKDTVKKLAYDAYKDSNADCVFLSCTNMPTLEIIDEIEQSLGVPVLSSNQVTLWWTLQILGWDKPISSGGNLLKNLRYWKK